jgi:arylsulfatase A-like enzyme
MLRTTALIAAFAAVVLTGQFSSAETAPKYNVLVIISDDLRTELGCYGSQLAKTPNIDALAASGVRFDRAYCQFALCNPSRTSMLSGRYPLTTGVLGNRTWFGHAHPDYVSLPKNFKQHGYTTLRAGKIFHGGLDDTDAWSVGGEKRTFDLRDDSAGVNRPISASFAALLQDDSKRPRQRQLTNAERNDRWLVIRGDGDGRSDARTADRAIELMQQHRDQPFFLACGFSKPHSPLEAPQRFYDLYELDDIRLPGASGNGKVSPRIVQSIDIYPTLVELCGLAPPEGLEGRSLAPLLVNPDADWDHAAYTIWSEDGQTATGTSIRQGNWRYSEYEGPGGGELLFDETADPHEMRNLAGDSKFADVQAKLAALVREHKRSAAKPAGETGRGPS